MARSKNKYINERKWIRKKINSGVSQSDLRNYVGIFSDKQKKQVMKEKGLSEKQYSKRYDFLGNVYYLLCNEKF